MYRRHVVTLRAAAAEYPIKSIQGARHLSLQTGNTPIEFALTEGEHGADDDCDGAVMEQVKEGHLETTGWRGVAAGVPAQQAGLPLLLWT